jgi:hypothetical protein
MPDDLVVKPAVWGTVAFVVVTLVGVTGGDGAAPFVIIFDVILLALGILAFVRTLLVAAERSRTEELSVAGIWFLSGAPTPIRVWLLGALAVQVVVGIAGGAVKPEPGAFGVLVPVFGLGLCGLWAVRSGSFPPRRSRRTD